MYQGISRNRRSAALMVIMTTLALVFTACSQQVRKNEQEEKKDPQPVSYPAVPVKFINPEYELSLPAELKPYEQVAVYAKVTGLVKQLNVDRGAGVRKGQLLEVLEAPEMEQHDRKSVGSGQSVSVRVNLRG